VLPLALALAGEVLLGAAILLLAPRNRDELAEERTDRWVVEMSELDRRAEADAPTASSLDDTAPLDDLRGFALPDDGRSDRP
jgi:hypothetical protein